MRRASNQRVGVSVERSAHCRGLFNDEELDWLSEVAARSQSEGSIAGKRKNLDIRKAKVSSLRRRGGFGWVYSRLWRTVSQANRDYFGFEIEGFDTAIQLIRYDGGGQDHYDWHMDLGRTHAKRKISVVMQLSHEDDYEGGDLLLLHGRKPRRGSRTRGDVTAFPSFVMHKVTPVTAGTRLSLVSWFIGPAFR